MSNKRAQGVSDVFKYVIAAVLAALILGFGYKMVKLMQDKACRAELADFEISVRELDKKVRFEDRQILTYQVPCSATQIYFFDRSKKIDAEKFKNIPILMDNLKTGGNGNIFIVKGSNVLRSFYAGNLQIENVYICMKPRDEKISLFIEGAGKSAKIEPTKDQLLC